MFLFKRLLELHNMQHKKEHLAGMVPFFKLIFIIVLVVVYCHFNQILHFNYM